MCSSSPCRFQNHARRSMQRNRPTKQNADKRELAGVYLFGGVANGMRHIECKILTNQPLTEHRQAQQYIAGVRSWKHTRFEPLQAFDCYRSTKLSSHLCQLRLHKRPCAAIPPPPAQRHGYRRSRLLIHNTCSHPPATIWVIRQDIAFREGIRQLIEAGLIGRHGGFAGKENGGTGHSSLLCKRPG